MIEPSMEGAWVHETGERELLDPSQPLENGAVDQLLLQICAAYKPMDRSSKFSARAAVSISHRFNKTNFARH